MLIPDIIMAFNDQPNRVLTKPYARPGIGSLRLLQTSKHCSGPAASTPVRSATNCGASPNSERKTRSWTNSVSAIWTLKK